MTVKQLSQRLSDRAESVCNLLLPNGKRNSGKWEIGDISGNGGKSLQVDLQGQHAGSWRDWANGEMHGDLLDLWQKVRGLSLHDACQDAKKFLGISDTNGNIIVKHWSKPTRAGLKRLTAGQKVDAYLRTQRCLLTETLAAYKVVEKDGHIVFPCLSLSGELLNLKHLMVERPDGKKVTWMEKGCSTPIWGWQAVDPHSRSLIITEGEFDAMTWHQWGFNYAVSVPNGCSSMEWIDLEWKNLELYDTIFLSFDMDEPGVKSAQLVAKKLGLHRCRIVELPRKDANDCLQHGAASGDAKLWIESAKYIAPEELADPSAFNSQVNEILRPTDARRTGLYMPLLGTEMRFRPQEVTLFSGISSHGKSTLWSHIMVRALASGYKAAICSLEASPSRTLLTMMCQWYGKDEPTPEEVEQFSSQAAGNLWVYDMLGTVSAKQVLEISRYVCSRHAADFVVIDSLMKLDIAEDDYNGQRAFLNELCMFSKRSNTHVFLVAHPRKGSSEKQRLGKLDVSGSGSIVAQADNIIMVKRNRDKEEKVKAGRDVDPEVPDTFIMVEKQRETGVEFIRKAWFHKPSKQFLDRWDSHPMCHQPTSAE